jgi:hypothetical protein
LKGNIKLSESHIFGICMKIQFFRYILYYQHSVFRVSATIGPSCSLLTVCYHELFDFKTPSFTYKKSGFFNWK